MCYIKTEIKWIYAFLFRYSIYIIIIIIKIPIRKALQKLNLPLLFKIKPSNSTCTYTSFGSQTLHHKYNLDVILIE